MQTIALLHARYQLMYTHLTPVCSPEGAKKRIRGVYTEKRRLQTSRFVSISPPATQILVNSKPGFEIF